MIAAIGGNEQVTARLQYPVEFSNRFGKVGHVVHHVAGKQAVEVCTGKGQALCVCCEKTKPGARTKGSSGLGNHTRRQIGEIGRPVQVFGLGRRFPQSTRTTADLENAGMLREVDLTKDSTRPLHRGRTVVLV